MSSINPLCELSESEYKDIVSASPQSTAFHSIGWLRVLRDGLGVRVRLIGLLDRNAKIVAACPVVYREFLGLPLIAGSPLPQTFTPYQGVLFRETVSDSLRMDTTRKLCAYLDLPYGFFKWLPTQIADGLNVGRDVVWTATIDTNRSEDELLRAMTGSTRNQVRQAERRGAMVRYTNVAGDWIDDYIRLSKSTYQRQGLRSPMRREFLEAVFSHSHPSEASILEDGRVLSVSNETRSCMCGGDWGAAVALAYQESEVIAASLFAWDRSTVYYIDSVSDRSRQALRPNNAIIWGLMQWAHREGFRTLDLVGANIPGIAEFKLGFGAVRVPVTCTTHMNLAGEMMYRLRRLAVEMGKRVRTHLRHS